MDDGAQNVFLFIAYLLGGAAIGIGGWPHWSPGVRTLYGCLFLVHALGGSPVTDVRPLARE